MTTVERGRRGEDLASAALKAHSYELVERNWRSRAGEIDIVACDDNTWVFVEVKLRQGDAFGSPEDAVTLAKQERLLQAAFLYLSERGLADVSWRIDVVAIELADSGLVDRLTLYKDAVRGNG